ncbi:SusC/RagA family TonB-linked outer membrane protein [Niabella drilacis]|uniref:TonB-linked outer membrane protein, SusC/RagA family n=1 Tax=Niabella drilacis (strain DSM 25811 / CCM 8410 / CCUG 62505 / LMG 26954 / E90) TaxID=1285928 RepID=A0A1G6R4D3_NIADE|nr:TonB-dependent receptor [Niabella drilacis]SDC99388.1 TonB-linked outer membrane protein, SusC/RagA family [Niabella drilacis]
MSRLTKLLFATVGWVCLMFIAVASSAQEGIKLRGRVVATDGTPLVGATIQQEKGTAVTVSGDNGHFEIDVARDSRITVTMVGYQPLTVAAASGEMIIELKAASSDMDEVVVVGYGTQKRSRLTSAVSSMNAKELQLIPTSNLSNVLAGRLSGTFIQSGTGTPGIGSGIRVRAKASWNGGNSVYVIDGVVRDKTSFDALDPNEVEDITILKDAASAAIYGSRSTNGVILVTTKSGKSGRPLIQFNAITGIEKPGKMPSYMGVADALKLSQAVNGGIGQDEIDWVLKNNPKGENYLDAAYQDPTNQKYALSASGGNDVITYYLGGSYYNEKGFLPNVWYNKYNLRGKISAKLTKDLTVGLNLSNSYGTRNRFNFTYDYGSDDLNNLWGKLLYWDAWAPAYIDGKPVNPGWLGNPVEMMKNGGYWRNNNQQIDALINAEYRVPFVKGLSLKMAYSKNFDNSYIKTFAKRQLLYNFKTTGTNNLIRTNEVIGTTMSTEPGTEYIGNEYAKSNTYQLNGQLSYDRSFGLHHISGDAVYEQWEAQYNSFTAYRYNFPLLATDQFFAASGDTKDWRNSGSESQDGRLSYIFRLGYDYDGRYLLSASMRRDGSVKFAPGRRWGNFPSISGGWVLSKEAFYNNTALPGIMDFAKIRFSYGSNGYDDPEDRNIKKWLWLDQYNISSSSYYLGTNGTAAPRLLYSGIPIANLTWEKSRSYDLGIDLTLLKQFNLTLDFWKRQTSDVLGTRILVIPAEFGGTLPAENYGIVDSKGMEIELGYRHEFNPDFSINVRGNFNIATNKVIKRDRAANALDVDNPIGKTLSYGTGYVYSGILRTQADIDALPTGFTYFGAPPTLGSAKFEDISGPGGKPDGKVDSYDRVVLGNYFGSDNAPYSGGLLLSLSYKGITLETLFAGSAGFKLSYGDAWGRNFGGGAKVPTYHADSWSTDNQEGTTPKLYPWGNPQSYGYTETSTFNVYNGSFVRMKYINIGYQLPSGLLKHVGVKGINIFASGNNLFYASKFKFYDPEVYQFMSYPTMRSFSAGIDVKL